MDKKNLKNVTTKLQSNTENNKNSDGFKKFQSKIKEKETSISQLKHGDRTYSNTIKGNYLDIMCGKVPTLGFQGYDLQINKQHDVDLLEEYVQVYPDDDIWVLVKNPFIEKYRENPKGFWITVLEKLKKIKSYSNNDKVIRVLVTAQENNKFMYCFLNKKRTSLKSQIVPEFKELGFSIQFLNALPEALDKESFYMYLSEGEQKELNKNSMKSIVLEEIISNQCKGEIND